MSSQGYLADGTIISIGTTENADFVEHADETFVVGNEITNITIGGKSKSLIDMTPLNSLEKCYRKSRRPEISDTTFTVNLAKNSPELTEFNEGFDGDPKRWIRIDIEGRGDFLMFFRAHITNVGDVTFSDGEKLTQDFTVRRVGPLTIV